MGFNIGCDIGGTYVRVVIADNEKILLKITANTVKKGPVESLPLQIIDLIEIGLKDLGISDKEIVGIGTSSAGPFVGGNSISAPNICGDDQNDWVVIPYLQTLEKRFGSDVKYELGNDCVSAVKAETLFGAGRNHKNVIYVTISTGVGTGIVSEGKLISGKGKNAGHFGHTIVQKDGIQCGCGQRGCIETMVSGRHIPLRAQRAGLDVNDAKEVFDLYYKGDPIAKEIIQETIEYLGILFINIINSTDTEVLIVGGGVFLNNLDLLIPEVEKYISENSLEILSEGTEFTTPELGEYVGDLAGLSLILSENIIDKWEQSRPWEKEDVKTIEM